MTEESKSRILPITIGVGAALVVGAAVVAFLPAPEEPVAVVTSPVASVPDQVAEPVVEAPVPDVMAEAPASAKPSSPSFDTFRVEPDGNMVIAGRAEPGQVVGIVLAGEVIDRVTADGSGAFVSLPNVGPSELPRRLILLADPDGARVASETSYIVAPLTPSVLAEVVTAPEPATPPDLAAVAEADTPLSPSLSATEIAQPPDPAPTAPPTVLEADAEGVRVVQAAPSLAPPNVALDAITYDPEGEVQLAGRATGEGAVQVYIDNRPITASPVQEGGDWRVDLPDVDTGVYTLRIDELDISGEVVSRLETPFRREEAAEVAAVLAEETDEEGFEVAVKTVQPGATLWAIAEENLGNGIFYVEVFEANADLIRDPDLIYPGQIFRIPDISQ